MTKDEKSQTLDTLNRIIQCRLALSELPQQLKNFKIGNELIQTIILDNISLKLYRGVFRERVCQI